MKEENCGQKDKKKILVEFEVPEKWSNLKSGYFSLYLPDNVAYLEKDDAEFLFSGKIVKLSNSKNYDTIP